MTDVVRAGVSIEDVIREFELDGWADGDTLRYKDPATGKRWRADIADARAAFEAVRDAPVAQRYALWHEAAKPNSDEEESLPTLLGKGTVYCVVGFGTWGFLGYAIAQAGLPKALAMILIVFGAGSAGMAAAVAACKAIWGKYAV